MRKFPSYGIFGITTIIISEILLFLELEIVGWYFTPLVWTGYIFFIDALQVRFYGISLISSRPRELLLMLPWSVVCWLIFEAYNLHLCNWTYVGLPENLILRYIGYSWSFATIFPAILETAEFFKHFLLHSSRTSSPASKKVLIPIILLGICFLVAPLLLEQYVAAKLFAFVWIGFFFLLDPVNILLGGKSIIQQLKEKNYSTTIALVFSGILCGILWEFWNYWAIAKWVYSVPISFVGPKVFEMPLLGYLGFIPFAFEVYVMQEFLVSVFPSIRPSQANLPRL
ncbi:MAG: hypothetical protein QME52_00655 [Bacteroidota bacterium]|nr:hypothetical protein [Bacteroidota bacterium]